MHTCVCMRECVCACVCVWFSVILYTLLLTLRWPCTVCKQDVTIQLQTNLFYHCSRDFPYGKFRTSSLGKANNNGVVLWTKNVTKQVNRPNRKWPFSCEGLPPGDLGKVWGFVSTRGRCHVHQGTLAEAQASSVVDADLEAERSIKDSSDPYLSLFLWSSWNWWVICQLMSYALYVWLWACLEVSNSKLLVLNGNRNEQN